MGDLYENDEETIEEIIEERVSDPKVELKAKAEEAKRAKMEYEKAMKAEKKAAKAEKKAKRKAKGTGKKWLTAIGLACVFGLVASIVFQCSNRAINKIFGKSSREASVALEQNGADFSDDTSGTQNVDIPAEIKRIEDKVDKLQGNNSPGRDDGINNLQEAGNGIGSVSQVVKETMPSIVAITNKDIQTVRSWYGMGETQQYEAVSAGSGIIVGQNDTELLIVTNAHVVAAADTITVCFIDEQAYEAEIKGSDDMNDIAVIAVDLSDISGSTLDAIKVATIGDSNELEIGEQVVAIGNALGYGQSVTTGIVSALDRTIDGKDDSQNYIQTDAAINPGNSGGALLNMKGELVGINSAKLANTKIEGMGYAIPISMAGPIMEDLMNMVTRHLVDESEVGYLGISGFSVTNEVAAAYNIPKGIYISETTEGTPAEKAGLQKGDVIIKFDGMAMDSINKLRERLGYYKAGETVDVIIARSDDGEYKEKTIKVTLGKRTEFEPKEADSKKTEPKSESDDSDSSDDSKPENGQRNGGFSFGGNTFQYSIPNNIFDIFNW